MEEIKQSGALRFSISNALIDEIMTTLHTEQGHSLLKHWNLPDIYCDVARDHHAEALESNTFMAIVRLANMTCNKVGIGMSPDASTVPAVSHEADFLGVSEIDLAELEVSLDDFVSRIPTLFSSKDSKNNGSSNKNGVDDDPLT